MAGAASCFGAPNRGGDGSSRGVGNWGPYLLCAVAVAGLLWAELRGSRAGLWLAKPVASLAFLWVALAMGALETSYGQLVLLGLVLCLLGDLLLIPLERPTVFRAGVFAFLAGHLAYSAAFLTRPLDPLGLAVGAVLLAIGLLLRKRVPVFGLLVPYGTMAIVFGFLFGSIFSNEELIPALWMHPIDYPAKVMGIAIGFGACILTLGLLLDALGAFWRRRLLFWLATRGGILAAYLGLVTAGAGYLGAIGPVAAALGLNLMWLGFAWFIVGTVLTSHHNKLLEIPKAIGELLESMLQIAVNTVSFVRVGAFALAHAGLSAAVMGMAAATGGGLGWLLVMILGNALVIALEGLIVSIQTTRLLLFEFFIRFLTAEGRQLRPLIGPGTAIRPTR